MPSWRQSMWGEPIESISAFMGEHGLAIDLVPGDGRDTCSVTILEAAGDRGECLVP